MTGKCECYVTGVTEERKKLFQEVCEDGRIPIRCPIPQGFMKHEKLQNPTAFFEMAIERLTEEQKQRLIKQLARRFGISEDEVKRELPKHGCPVRWDSEIVVHWCSLHVRCVL